MIKMLYFILNKKQRKIVVGLGFLLLIGVCLEMLGLGLLLPVLGVLATPEYVLPIKSIPIIREIFLHLNFTYLGHKHE